MTDMEGRIQEECKEFIMLLRSGDQMCIPSLTNGFYNPLDPFFLWIRFDTQYFCSRRIGGPNLEVRGTISHLVPPCLKDFSQAGFDKGDISG